MRKQTKNVWKSILLEKWKFIRSPRERFAGSILGGIHVERRLRGRVVKEQEIESICCFVYYSKQELWEITKLLWQGTRSPEFRLRTNETNIIWHDRQDMWGISEHLTEYIAHKKYCTCILILKNQWIELWKMFSFIKIIREFTQKLCLCDNYTNSCESLLAKPPSNVDFLKGVFNWIIKAKISVPYGQIGSKRTMVSVQQGAFTTNPSNVISLMDFSCQTFHAKNELIPFSPFCPTTPYPPSSNKIPN